MIWLKMLRPYTMSKWHFSTVTVYWNKFCAIKNSGRETSQEENAMKRFTVVLISMVLVLGIASIGLCKGTLIAAYTFDNDPANGVKDVTGNGHNGVIKDATYVDGKFGKALEFDGTTSQVEIPNKDDLNIKGAITLEAWVKPSKYNALSAVVQKWGDNTNRRQYLLCFVGEKLSFYISGSGTTWPAASGTTAVKTGEWTHIAGTCDSTVIRAYVNGKMDAETANAEGLFASDVPAWIGGYGPDADFGDNRHFPGVVDEVRFWSGALTADEIQNGMSGTVSPVDLMGKIATQWGSIKNQN